MSAFAVPLTAISFNDSIAEEPLTGRQVVSLDQDLDYQRIWTLEWFWGLSKGTLPLKSDLNILEMRADMLQSYDEEGWTLVPTADTLKAMEVILRHNVRAEDAFRKVFTEEISTPVHEYRLVPIGMKAQGLRPTIYVDVGEATPRAVRHPYNDLPTIKSGAHPFFVVYKLEDFLMSGGRPMLVWLRPIIQSILRVSRFWQRTPPASFRYGPDLPLEHRHPASISGDADLMPRQESHNGDGPDENDAPPVHEGHPGAVDVDHHTQSTSSLGKRKRAADTPADLADAPPRVCPRILEPKRTKNLYRTRSAIEAWVARIEPCDPGLRTSPASAIAEADADLAQYVQEPLRDPQEVMRTGRRLSQGSTPLEQKRDTSRFSSCNWAEQKYCIYLWGYRDGNTQP
ncbi:hypothetical protein EV714DRAFT_280649 [Schizophyllum commune]